MPMTLASSSTHKAVQALCLVVLATIAGAAVYAVWIWIANYSRIGV